MWRNDFFFFSLPPTTMYPTERIRCVDTTLLPSGTYQLCVHLAPPDGASTTHLLGRVLGLKPGCEQTVRKIPKSLPSCACMCVHVHVHVHVHIHMHMHMPTYFYVRIHGYSRLKIVNFSVESFFSTAGAESGTTKLFFFG